MWNSKARGHRFETDIGPPPADLYDVVKREFVKTNVTGQVKLALPANTPAVIVITPSPGKRTHDGQRMLVNGIVVDYGSN